MLGPPCTSCSTVAFFKQKRPNKLYQCDWSSDVCSSDLLEPMVREGHASSLTEMAMRFAISNPKLPTAEIGLANIGELNAALSAVSKGPLSGAALARLKQVQAGFLGEAR